MQLRTSVDVDKNKSRPVNMNNEQEKIVLQTGSQIDLRNYKINDLYLTSSAVNVVLGDRTIVLQLSEEYQDLQASDPVGFHILLSKPVLEGEAINNDTGSTQTLLSTPTLFVPFDVAQSSPVIATEQFMKINALDLSQLGFDGLSDFHANVPHHLPVASSAAMPSTEMDMSAIMSMAARVKTTFIAAGLNVTPDGNLLDVDGDGDADALTDALTIVKYLLDFRGANLIDGSVDAGGIRTTATSIEAYLGELVAAGVLDIDGNGQTDALTDGLLVLRHLFGFQGALLVDGAVGTGATRTSAADIADYIDTLTTNDAPALASISVAIDERTANGTLVADINDSNTGKDTDIDFQSLTYSIVSGNVGNAFAINASTGQITVADSSKLDFETTPSFVLTVSASDGTKTDTTLVSITLNDVSEQRSPDIIDAAFEIDENSPNGFVVANVNDNNTAVDVDADGDALTYSIVAGNTGGAFAIDDKTGEIKVADSSKLDFETTPTFALTVQADDGHGNSDTAVITVNLKNLNDNAPVISNTTASVAENAGNNVSVATVSASDADKDSLAYSITGGNTDGAFTINPTTGEITVANSAALDFEKVKSFILEVSVTDDGVTFSKGSVTINLTNANDESPLISGATVNIDENTAKDTEVWDINDVKSGKDEDIEGNAITYKILAGDPNNAFKIDPTSGKITVNDLAQLNFEKTKSFSLFVEASDGVKSSTATITVLIADVKESPVINNQSFDIAENKADLTVVATIIASDEDGGGLTFEVLAGDPNKIFTVNPTTGVITVSNSAKLDAETITDGKLDLTVKVTDNGGLSSTATITVNVTNVDDNKPVVNNVTVDLIENPPLDHLVADLNDENSKADKDADGEVLTYTLVSGDPTGIFKVDSSTGKITVVKPDELNFQTTQSMVLNISIKDEHGNEDTAVVTINFNQLPVIDNKSVDTYENFLDPFGVSAIINLNEAKTGSDNDLNGDQLTYSIKDGNSDNAFHINQQTGEIFVNVFGKQNSDGSVTPINRLDTETAPKRELVVQVADKASNIDTAVVTVNVLNVNDNNPQINDVSVKLDEFNGLFNGPPAGTTPVQVDLNTITGDFITNLNDIKSTVDKDADGDVITYSFQSIKILDNNGVTFTDLTDFFGGLDALNNQKSGAFVINQSSGALSVNTAAQDVGNFHENIDLEWLKNWTHSDLIIEISANDGLGGFDTVNVTLKLNPLNDNAPLIADQAVVTVASTAATGTLVFNMRDENTWSDKDRDGDQLIYSIKSGNFDNVFDINPSTGEITVKNGGVGGALSNSSRTFYDLVVNVTDGQGNPLTDNDNVVRIELNPGANAAPAIDNAIVNGIKEHTFSSNGSFIYDVSDLSGKFIDNNNDGFRDAAEGDADKDGNAITYKIVSGNDDGAFDINRDTGVIIIKDGTKLDFETSSSRQVQVLASDGVNSDTATITVNLADVGPIIAADFGVVEVGAGKDAVIGDLKDAITKSDSTFENKPITYTLISTSPLAFGNNPFAINDKTGVVSVINPSALNDEITFGSQATQFALTVQASDGKVTNTSSFTVFVNHPGVFANQEVSLDEYSPITGGNFHDVNDNTDDDFENVDGDRYEYAIVSGNTGNAFSINKFTGELYVLNNEGLIAKTNPTFGLKIKATEFLGGSQTILKEHEFTVTVKLNNVGPTIDDGSALILGDEKQGDVLFDFSDTRSGTDKDISGDSINYTLGSHNDIFEISGSGVVTIKDITGFKALALPVTLLINATDGNNGDTAVLYITNVTTDLPPDIDAVTIAVNENLGVGSPLPNSADFIKDIHTGLDFDRNGNPITYTVNDPTGTFGMLDSSTGELVLLQDLDYEGTKFYSVVVTASDGKNTDSATVTIAVQNVNEAPIINDQTFTITESATPKFTTNPDINDGSDDLDVDGDGIKYKITAGDNGGKFTIDELTGVISATGSAIDRETTSSYQLTVTASDGKGLTNTATITIDVTDVNDSTPTFGNSGTFSINENQISPAVGTVTATDADTANITKLFYSLTGGGTGAGKFNIDSTTGEITATSPFNFEATPSVTLEVQVNDNGDALSGNHTKQMVTIDINNVGEAFAPDIKTSYDFTISETAVVGTNLADTINDGADDKDADGVALIYSLGGADHDGTFGINAATGQLILTNGLDFETKSVYNLTVTAADGVGVGVMTDTATVQIIVQDVVGSLTLNDVLVTNEANSLDFLREGRSGASELSSLDMSASMAMEDATAVYLI